MRGVRYWHGRGLWILWSHGRVSHGVGGNGDEAACGGGAVGHAADNDAGVNTMETDRGADRK